MLTSRAHPQDTGPWRDGHRHQGHAHFWDRAMSRGRFIGTVAGATGAALSARLWLPALAQAAAPSDATPKPIPGGFTFDGTLFHISGGPGAEPSSITDF